MNAFSKKATVLAAAGVDPSGGAGLLTDCAAIRAVSCHPAGVPTVLTVQNGLRFSTAEAVDASYLRMSIEAIAGVARIKAVKIGALKTKSAVETLADIFRKSSFPPVIVDPVMLSTSGGRLLDEDAVESMKQSLFPCAALVTPNLAEAAYIADMPVCGNIEEMTAAATRILSLGPKAVLVKGGHLDGENVTDVYADANGSVRILKTEKKAPYEVRGTGCALSSLIAAWLARGAPMIEAIDKSRVMLDRAVHTAVSIGPGPRLLGDFNP